MLVAWVSMYTIDTFHSIRMRDGEYKGNHDFTVQHFWSQNSFQSVPGSSIAFN
jgi:hypothetical protein